MTAYSEWWVGRDKNTDTCTFVCTQGESIGNYVICSEYILENANDVHGPNSFSDHRLISFSCGCVMFINVSVE